MGYLAIYRKYRPKTFDKVIGQEHVVTTLVNQIKADRIGHAYLFTGTRGTGKTSIAKIFAKAINCETPINGSPCGKCPTCVALNEQSNIDILEIDAASNNGVNEIRDLREKVQYPPVNCRYKVYIIDEVHMLSPQRSTHYLKRLKNHLNTLCLFWLRLKFTKCLRQFYHVVCALTSVLSTLKRLLI